MAFQKLNLKIDFPELEKKVLSYWEENDVLGKYLRKNENAHKRFSFFDGPITANNPMGVHHARGRTIKDLFQRFKNMQGFKQRFQNGFDCQGLWVEVEVEKALGFNSKKDIESYGLAKFTEACKERVQKFAEKITDQSKRLGYFMDWDNSYFTMSERNNLHIWAFLKKCHEKGLIYKGKSVTAWCPRCETGLSRHEQADSYKNITDTSFYIKFQIKGREKDFFLAWTTTPWTLTANVLLAINSELEYVKAKKDGEVFYLAKPAAEKLGFENYQSVDAKDLLGLEYRPPYPELECQKGVKHFVVDWRGVGSKEGTGVVHIAPGCGEDDFNLGKEKNAALILPLNQDGSFKKGYGDLTGEYAHNVIKKVAEHLKANNLLFKEEEVIHSYPYCWRCKTKCVFRAENSWFLSCEKIRPGLKKAAAKVNWIPDFTGKRMQDWLENMGDWMISRSRFYGLALPFYECSFCGELAVIGSKGELKKYAVEPDQVDALPCLHRPWIDKIEIKCSKCGEIVKRIPEVGDCWLDAGAVPFSTLDYLTNKAYWKKWFPAEFITEMIEQIRLWYFSMLVYGAVLEDAVPYKNVLNYVEVRDEKGERMSKSKGNGIPYDEAVSKMGADTMRWLYLAKQGRIPVNFGYDLAKDAQKNFFSTLWNSYRFFLGYACIELISFEKILDRKSSHPLDCWVLSRLSRLVEKVTKDLEAYDSSSATKAIGDFTRHDLSLWYIRNSRNRIGPSTPDGEDKLDCYATYFVVLNTLARVLAPFTPFISEKLWHALGYPESIHIQDWPVFQRSRIDEQAEEEMDRIRQIASLAHALRKEMGIKTRQPLSELQIETSWNRPDNSFIYLLKQEINVKKICYVEELRDLDKGFVIKQADHLRIALDEKITSNLEKEGTLRDITRRIQYLRKRAGYEPSDKIEVYYKGGNQLETLIEENKDRLKSETLAIGILKKPGEIERLENKEVRKIRNEELHLGVSKVE